MSVKIIYDNYKEIPEDLQSKATEVDGKWEMDAAGLLGKNSELLKNLKQANASNEKLSEAVETLKTQILTPNKVAVDKREFDALAAENEAFKTLGAFDEIKPKVEGYDDLKIQAGQAVKDRALQSAGVNDLAGARQFKSYDELDFEAEIKDGKEIFYRVATDDKGKAVKTAFVADSLKTDAFKDNLGTLVGEPGKRFFRQGTTAGGESNATRIRNEVREKEAARGNVAKSFVEAFSGTNPA